MENDILSALIGLVGAISNNGKTKQTDSIIYDAFLSSDRLDIIERIHQEKYTISPDCKFCQSPCGNTSDYPKEQYNKWTNTKHHLKERIISEIKRITLNTKKGEALPEIIYKSIAYIGYELDDRVYIELLEELKNDKTNN